MKIFCIEGNYRDAQTPICQIVLPDSTLLYSNRPFFVPDFDPSFSALLSPVVKINRLGKCVEPHFASRYFAEWSVAISIRADQTLADLRKAGLPWSEALAFDKSIIAGDFRPVADGAHDFPELSLLIDGKPAAQWSPGLCRESIDEIISLVSESNTLKTGDLILHSLAPQGVKLTPGHILEVEANGEILLTTPIR